MPIGWGKIRASKNPPGTRAGFRLSSRGLLLKLGFLLFFPPAAVPYWCPKPVLRNGYARNALSSRPPLRNGDRTEQIVLAADLSGADAGVSGAVRARDGGALQADHQRLLRQSRPQRADRS